MKGKFDISVKRPQYFEVFDPHDSQIYIKPESFVNQTSP